MKTFPSEIRPALYACLVLFCSALLAACGSDEPVSTERYQQNDTLVLRIRENLAASSALETVVEIDHSRLAQEAGAVMPPATVMIFSDPELESELVRLNPLVALDLPLRVLAFEDPASQSNLVVHNSFDYITSRYGLDPASSAPLQARYEQRIAGSTAGIPKDARMSFASDVMNPDGVLTLPSPYDLEETIERVNAAIDAQGDTVHFGTVDFQANARELGIETGVAYMILFGGPAPGGKAMAPAPTLGLDAFCQKMLIWEDDNGQIMLSFNDLLAIADRQGATVNLPLRVVNRRMEAVFTEALAASTD